MTDGPRLPIAGRVVISESPASSIKREILEAPDLTTFSQWIALQPISTHIGLLELIANDLYRRRDYPTLAGRVKDVAKDLRAMTRHHEKKV